MLLSRRRTLLGESETVPPLTDLVHYKNPDVERSAYRALLAFLILIIFFNIPVLRF
jgi:hypothetical protein